MTETETERRHPLPFRLLRAAVRDLCALGGRRLDAPYMRFANDTHTGDDE